jgi:dihydroxyacetone kinase phosphoprotein-dependent L subunit
MDTLSAEQVKSLLLHVADSVIEAKEALCDADRNIGDGDHGIGMALGFEAAREVLQSQEFEDVYALFSTLGRTMIKTMGGASGIIFGLLFYAGAKNMPPKGELSTADLSEIFAKALAEIKFKGQAQLGDKTLIDGLQPMVAAMQQSASQGDDFKTLFHKASLAAEQGKETSKGYVARIGKAKTLGDRAIGFPDPGCVSLTVICQAMERWAAQAL